MNTGTKILVVLAFLVAAFYVLEVALTLANQGLVGPVYVKGAIAAAALYYAISRLRKRKSVKEAGNTEGE